MGNKKGENGMGRIEDHVVSKELYERKLKEYNQKLEKNDSAYNRVMQDVYIFINAVRTSGGDVNDAPWGRMMSAAKEVNKDIIKRASAKRSVWVCGTYMGERYNRFYQRMRRMFYYDEITDLFKCIEEGCEMVPEQMDILKVIVCEIPVPHIHSYSDCLE